MPYGRGEKMTAEFTVAVHALVYLLHKNTVVSSQELAENIFSESPIMEESFEKKMW